MSRNEQVWRAVYLGRYISIRIHFVSESDIHLELERYRVRHNVLKESSRNM